MLHSTFSVPHMDQSSQKCLIEAKSLVGLFHFISNFFSGKNTKNLKVYSTGWQKMLGRRGKTGLGHDKIWLKTVLAQKICSMLTATLLLQY